MQTPVLEEIYEFIHAAADKHNVPVTIDFYIEAFERAVRMPKLNGVMFDVCMEELDRLRQKVSTTPNY